MKSPLKVCALGAAAVALLTLTPLSHGSLVYANNFDSAATVGAGVTASGLTNGGTGTAAGGPFAGSGGKSWNGSFFNNLSGGVPATESTLTLSNLGAHSHVSIDFMLGFLNSWDSSNGGVSPDFLDILIDGVLVYQLTTVAAGGTFNDYGGGTLVVDDGQIDIDQFFTDDLVDMGTAGFLTFAHTASTLTLGIRASGNGWQGGPDEYWGIDDLRINITGVNVNPMPEPGSLALLLAAGLAALAVRRRSN